MVLVNRLYPRCLILLDAYTIEDNLSYGIHASDGDILQFIT